MKAFFDYLLLFTQCIENNPFPTEGGQREDLVGFDFLPPVCPNYSKFCLWTSTFLLHKYIPASLLILPMQILLPKHWNFCSIHLKPLVIPWGVEDHPCKEKQPWLCTGRVPSVRMKCESKAFLSVSQISSGSCDLMIQLSRISCSLNKLNVADITLVGQMICQ